MKIKNFFIKCVKIFKFKCKSEREENKKDSNNLNKIESKNNICFGCDRKTKYGEIRKSGKFLCLNCINFLNGGFGNIKKMKKDMKKEIKEKKNKEKKIKKQKLKNTIL